MDSVIAFLFQQPDQAGELLKLLHTLWPKWLSQEPKPLHESMRDDWHQLEAICGSDDLVTAILGVSAVASVLQEDGALYEADRAEAQRRIQAACDTDVISNRQAAFDATTKFFGLRRVSV